MGFGTAGLGSAVYDTVSLALNAGFRKFDTAEEHDYWYDQAAVGQALEDFFEPELTQQCIVSKEDVSCESFCNIKGLKISTKIPPWELTSIDNIRSRAEHSRKVLVGFCDDYEAQDVLIVDQKDTEGGGREVEDEDEINQEINKTKKYPMDVYYIHAPECWDGWHTRCNGVGGTTLPLREAWLGMEGVAYDQNAKRIGLSNIWPSQLLDIINFVKERQEERSFHAVGSESDDPPPRLPDVVQIYSDPIHPSDEIRKICEKYGIEFVSYSTLGTQHSMKGQGNPVLGNVHVQRIAEKHNRSTAEVVLSWAMHHKNMSVIPRSSKEKHIRELANLLNGESFLDSHDLELIDSMSLN